MLQDPKNKNANAKGIHKNFFSFSSIILLLSRSEKKEKAWFSFNFQQSVLFYISQR